jgi:hypothetical protein
LGSSSSSSSSGNKLFIDWLDRLLGSVDGFSESSINITSNINTDTFEHSNKPNFVNQNQSDKLIINTDNRNQNNLIINKIDENSNCEINNIVQLSAVKSSKHLSFVCLAFVEVVDMLSLSCLTYLCKAIKLRRNLNKDSIDTFLQVSRNRLRILENMKNSSFSSYLSISNDKNKNNNNINAANKIDLSIERVKSWSCTLYRSGVLPIGIQQQCIVLGKNGYKGMDY